MSTAVAAPREFGATVSVAGDMMSSVPALRSADLVGRDAELDALRTQLGIGAYDTQEALEWGVTGPGLRATGLNWDLRKQRPYGGYDQIPFDVPTAVNGDTYDRCVVRVEEMRQSLRIIR